MMNEQESRSNEYLRPPLWHGKIAFGKVALGLTLQKRDAKPKNVKRFRQASLFELDEPFEQKSAVIRCRLLVLGLYLSFLACLTALWLTGNSFGNSGQLLPDNIANFIASRPAIVLLVPLASLLGCYFLLRHITYEIIAWPERFLDERQQMVRDQAHRNAYKLVKVACLLIPLYLCLYAAFWTAQAPASVPTPAFTPVHPATAFIDVAPNTAMMDVQAIHLYSWTQQAAGQTIILYGVVSPQTLLSIGNNGPGTIHAKHSTTPSSYLIIHEPMQPFYAIHTLASPSYRQVPTAMMVSWPNNPASLFLYYGTLLLSLLLMAIALPMSIVAWKERL